MSPLNKDDIRSAIAGQLDCAPTALADDDDLIQAGLNSIAIMAMAGGWRKQGVTITFAELAATPTIAAWAALLADATPATTTGAIPGSADGKPEESADDATPFPLAGMQHAYWIGRSAEQHLGGVAAHLYVEFDGDDIDPHRLERGVADLIAAHPMLRTRFLPDGTQQTLPAPTRPVFHTVDLRDRPADTVEAVLTEMRDRKTHQRLAVEDGEVLDVTLTRYGDNRARLHIDVDMLAADALSYRVLVAELADRYRGAAPAAPGYTYRRYLAERRTDPHTRERDRQWWQRRLADLPGAPDLPIVAVGDPNAAHRTVRRDHWLPPAAKQRLTAAAHARGITPAMAVAAVFADTIGGWSAQPRFLLNIPLFQREPLHPDVDRVIGDFTSSVLLDVDVTEPVAVTDRARELQHRMYDSAAHGGYPGLDVLRELGRHHGAPVLAPIVFTSALDLGELFSDVVLEAFGDPVWIVSQGPQVLLDAQITEVRGGLLLNWDVRDAMFPPGLIDAMFARFTAAVQRLADGDAGWAAEAAVHLPAEQARTRAAVNATAGPTSGRCLHTGFFDHAATQPDAPAVHWGLGAEAGHWTYRELADQALAVAAALHDRGVRAGDTVAVHLPKGPDQVLAALAVLSAGASYVPIGVDQPPARRDKVLASADAVAVLTNATTRVDVDLPVLDIDAARTHPPLPGAERTHSDEIAYVIYTSGSTGEPKGVECHHSGAMNTIDALNDWFGIDSADRTLALSALEFDLSVYDIFGMFAVGGSVVVLDTVQRATPTSWVELLRAHRVSVLNCVPSLLDMLLELGGDRLGDSLRAVILGGDWVSADLARRLARQVPDCRFAGLGGATEAAIHNTICEVTGDPPDHWTTIPFGIPLRNTCCRVVSPAGRDCPDWVPGELWVGGVNVAAGYRNDPQRTAQRFIEHDGLRWYRTGDMARYWPDGTLEFLGRADNQVQLRGYRVELGEVETALRAGPGVRNAVATVIGSAAPQLVAAVTVEADGADGVTDTDAIAAAVAELVPDYMVPDPIVVLDRMPLTPNGKLDRRAVTALLVAESEPVSEVPPADDLEAALAALVAEVLDVPSVGVTRDFFALGGDSVLATTVIARVRDWLQTEHAVVADLFAGRSVAGLAARLRQRESDLGTPDRLPAVARIYLEVAALTDEEVMAAG